VTTLLSSLKTKYEDSIAHLIFDIIIYGFCVVLLYGVLDSHTNPNNIVYTTTPEVRETGTIVKQFDAPNQNSTPYLWVEVEGHSDYVTRSIKRKEQDDPTYNVGETIEWVAEEEDFEVELLVFIVTALMILGAIHTPRLLLYALTFAPLVAVCIYFDISVWSQAMVNWVTGCFIFGLVVRITTMLSYRAKLLLQISQQHGNSGILSTFVILQGHQTAGNDKWFFMCKVYMYRGDAYKHADLVVAKLKG